MENLLLQIERVLLYLGPVVPFVIIGFLALYIFWSDAQITRKDRNSVFDIYLFASVFMVFWGRISYLVSNWEQFKGLPFSLAPYERYIDGTYFFRLPPWRYLAFLNEGVLELEIFAIFTSFFVILTLLALHMKRWKIKEIFGGIVASSSIGLGLSLMVIAVYSGSYDLFISSIVLSALPVIYTLLQMILVRINRVQGLEFVEKWYFKVSFGYAVVALMANAYLLFNLELSTSDYIHLLVWIILNIGLVLLFALDLNRKSIMIEEIIVPSSRISTNTPVRLRKEA